MYKLSFNCTVPGGVVTFTGAKSFFEMNEINITADKNKSKDLTMI
jgi:hypothetical protein